MRGHTMHMERYAFYLRKEQLAFLKSLACKGFTVSEQIRIALDKYIDEMRSKTISSSSSKNGSKKYREKS